MPPQKITRLSLSLPESQGFSLVEVLVAMLIIALFTVVGMQAFVSAVAIKTRAKQDSEITNWMLENLESDKQTALDVTAIPYTSTNLSNDVTSTSSSIIVDSPANLRNGDHLIVGTDSVDNIIASISGNVVTLANTLDTNQSQNSTVIARCRSDDLNGGYGQYLIDNFSAVMADTVIGVNQGERTISGRPYTIRRTSSPSSTPPHAIAEVTYTVSSPTNPEVAKISTEIVPNAFFQCP